MSLDPGPAPEASRSRIVERAEGRLGELVLRAAGRHYEIILNGVFLMDTRGGESERLLVRRALAGRSGPLRLLIGGLGVGFSLDEALRAPSVEQVTVVEIEPQIIAWHGAHLAPFSRRAASDPRATIVNADLALWLESAKDAFDGICLDVDNGPTWTVTEANGRLYTDDGLALLRRRLKPAGVLTLWSAAEAPGFADRLRRVFDRVETVSVPVPRGEPDIVYVASRF